jgi:hypothetical protein
MTKALSKKRSPFLTDHSKIFALKKIHPKIVFVSSQKILENFKLGGRIELGGFIPPQTTWLPVMLRFLLLQTQTVISICHVESLLD